VSGRRRLLCVFAHPDDESYGPGGTIARYALEDAAVNLLMFTCGEAGTIGISKEIPREELCSIRTNELAAACDALGVAEYRILGTPDRGVADIPPSWAVDQIVRDIRKYRPHVLLTFHHKGVSGHSDHIAVARYVEEAFDRVAGDPDAPSKLYGYGIPRHKAVLYERPNLVPLEDDEIDAVVDVPEEAMDRKLEAIRLHRTQLDFFRSMQAKFDYRKEARPEHFHLRKTRLGRGRRDGVEDDLFGGIGT
jgi:LmbE family N-acetylglucosaminyl deacetylase